MYCLSLQLFPHVADLIIEERNNVKGKSGLKTIPAPLTNDEYIMMTHYKELLMPLVILTNQCQCDGITSPDLIPNIVKCYTGKYMQF